MRCAPTSPSLAEAGSPESFFSDRCKFPVGRGSISGENVRRAATAANFPRAAPSLWVMERPIRRRLLEDPRVPLPIIGVRRALMQGGAHDDAPCDEPSGEAARCRRAVGAAGNGVFFEGGGGWVD